MKRRILIAICILMIARDICVAGQDKSRQFDLGEITVTASRVERQVTEVSSNVNVITEKEIEDSNAKNVPDLLEHIEGIYMYDSSGVGTAGRVNMRGFWGGMSTHQLILVDGIPQNKAADKLVDWNLIPLDNIERIEIVKGPVSALYGDNAMSGVINIITKRPGPAPQTKIAVAYGSFNTQNYRVSTTGLFPKMGYYLNTSRKVTDGFRRHCNYEDIHLNGKVDFLMDDTQGLKLSLDHHESERGAFPWALTEAQIEQDRRQARPGTENDKGKVKKDSLGLTYAREIDEISRMEGTVYYRHEDSESFYTSGSSGSSTKEQLEDENSPSLLVHYNTNLEFFDKEHSFTTGIDLEKNNFNYEEYSAPYQIRGSVSKDYKVGRDKIGPYVQDEINLVDKFKLVLGMRYDWVRFGFTDSRDDSNSKRKKMSKESPKFGGVYTYKENSNLYANYGQAFRTPTIGQMFAYGSYANPDLAPEEAQNYEVGVRHQINEELKTKAAFYWMNLDNEIWYDYAEKKYKNYGKTFHKGIETGLNFKMGERGDGFANYSYIQAKNESGDYEGKYLTNIPIHKGSLGLGYQSVFGLKSNLILNWVGSSYLDSDNEDNLPSYATIDTKISYEKKWWLVFLAVDNLLDKKYNSYGFTSSPEMKYFNPAPGRTFTFGLEARF